MRTLSSPLEVIVAHRDPYRYISLALVASVMKRVGIQYRVRWVLDYRELLLALQGSTSMPLVIADPRFIPPITHLQDKHPIEDYVTTVSAYLYASADHRAMLLFGEDEIDLLPGAEEILEHGLAGVESQFSIVREPGSILRLDTVTRLISTVLDAKQQ